MSEVVKAALKFAVVIVAVAVVSSIAIVTGSAQLNARPAAPTPSPVCSGTPMPRNFRLEGALIRMEHNETQIDRLLAAVDENQKELDGFTVTLNEQTETLRRARLEPCLPEKVMGEEGEDSKMETQADADERCKGDIDEQETTIRTNTAKRDFHEAKLRILQARLAAAYQLREKLEREVAGTPYEAH